jgi:hypothetical protein
VGESTTSEYTAVCPAATDTVVDGSKQKSPVALPLSATLCGLPVTLSVSTRVALLAAEPLVHAGPNVTCTVQVPPAETFAPLQVFALTTKSAAPLTAIELNDSAPVPVLVTVIVCGCPEVPASCPPKLMLAGVIEMPACVTLPISAIFCGLFGALSTRLMVAVRATALTAVGVNTTLNVQLAAARKLGGQLFVSAKSAAFAPATLTPLIESDPALAFSTVTVCGALAIPTLCGEKFRLDGEI